MAAPVFSFCLGSGFPWSGIRVIALSINLDDAYFAFWNEATHNTSN